MKNNDRSDFKPIYIHWYEDEFQADLVVRRMSSRQRAFFRNVLMYCYFGKERPYLTTSDDELWLIADADSKEEWLASKQPILAKFTLTVRKDGQRLLANKRVLEEWQIIEGWLAQKKKAGLASAAVRRRENGHSNDPETLVENSLSTSELGTNRALAPTPVQQPVDSPLTGSQQPPKSFSTYEDEDVNADGDKEEQLCANEGSSHDSVVDSEEENPEREQMIAAVRRVWDYYIQKMGKNPRLLTFTPLRQQKGLARFREVLKKTRGDMAKAEKVLKIAVDTLASSSFHMGNNEQKKQYNSWETNLFVSTEKLERWLEQSR